MDENATVSFLVSPDEIHDMPKSSLARKRVSFELDRAGTHRLTASIFLVDPERRIAPAPDGMQVTVGADSAVSVSVKVADGQYYSERVTAAEVRRFLDGETDAVGSFRRGAYQGAFVIKFKETQCIPDGEYLVLKLPNGREGDVARLPVSTLKSIAPREYQGKPLTYTDRNGATKQYLSVLLPRGEQVSLLLHAEDGSVQERVMTAQEFRDDYDARCGREAAERKVEASMNGPQVAFSVHQGLIFDQREGGNAKKRAIIRICGKKVYAVLYIVDPERQISGPSKKGYCKVTVSEGFPVSVSAAEDGKATRIENATALELRRYLDGDTDTIAFFRRPAK